MDFRKLFAACAGCTCTAWLEQIVDQAAFCILLVCQGCRLIIVALAPGHFHSSSVRFVSSFLSGEGIPNMLCNVSGSAQTVTAMLHYDTRNMMGAGHCKHNAHFGHTHTGHGHVSYRQLSHCVTGCSPSSFSTVVNSRLWRTWS